MISNIRDNKEIVFCYADFVSILQDYFLCHHLLYRLAFLISEYFCLFSNATKISINANYLKYGNLIISIRQDHR